MGRGRGAAFSCFFCFPPSIPRGEPSPSLSPSRPPLQRLLLIYDLLEDKRDLLVAASNWCAGTTVAICLVGRWGGPQQGRG